jgi:hypothetical protein
VRFNFFAIWPARVFLRASDFNVFTSVVVQERRLPFFMSYLPAVKRGDYCKIPRLSNHGPFNKERMNIILRTKLGCSLFATTNRSPEPPWIIPEETLVDRRRNQIGYDRRVRPMAAYRVTSIRHGLEFDERSGVEFEPSAPQAMNTATELVEPRWNGSGMLGKMPRMFAIRAFTGIPGQQNRRGVFILGRDMSLGLASR